MPETREEKQHRVEVAYLEHKEKILGFCLKICGNYEDAEDYTQKAFLAALKNIDQFRDEARVENWICSIARNEIFMEFRRKRMKKRIGELQILDPEDANKVVDKRIKDPTGDIFVEEVLAMLPKGYRNVLALHDLCGYEHTDIGRMLKVDPGTSKSQLFKARCKAFKVVFPGEVNRARRPKRKAA